MRNNYKIMSLLIALLMLVCTGCGRNVSNSENESVSTGLFASATPSRSVISMSYYDGTEGVQGFLVIWTIKRILFFH